jgi:hypothetical protein
VKVAVERRQGDRPPGVRDDPGGVVFLLDLACEVDGGQAVGHALGVIARERVLGHHLQGPDLAEMQVRVDEGLGHEIAAGVDLLAGGRVERGADPRDQAVRNRDIDRHTGVVTQAGIANASIDVGHDAARALRIAASTRRGVIGVSLTRFQRGRSVVSSDDHRCDRMPPLQRSN